MEWFPLAFSLQFLFIVDKFSLGNNIYGLFYFVSYTKIFTINKNKWFSQASIICLAILIRKLLLLEISFNLFDKVHYSRDNKVSYNFLVWSIIFSLLKTSSPFQKLINEQKGKETVFNYCVQWSGANDQRLNVQLFQCVPCLILYNGFR